MRRLCFHLKPGLSRLFGIFMLAVWVVASSGCSEQIPEPEPAETRPGGAATTSIIPFPELDKVTPNLPEQERPLFYAGRALAHQPWVKAPTITDARDGLGPIYNARGCLACHIRGGKSRMPDNADTPLFGPLIRMSVVLDDAAAMTAAANSHDGVIPDPVYGDQLQTQSIALMHQLRQATPTAMAEQQQVPPEAYAYITWHEQAFIYPDGSSVSLRKPELDLRYAAYGDFDTNTRFSVRNAPAIHGMGLLELIAQSDLEALADPEDADGNGISGRQNRVWDARSQRWLPGRFGHKANRPNMDMIVASAFANDIGISNPLFPSQPCTAYQPLCEQQRNGNDSQGMELPDNLLRLVTNFTRNLGVPQRRNVDNAEVLEGRTLFYATGCVACHQPSYTTVASTTQPHLGNQRIWPYTDLLLHDMGPALADGRPDFAASGSEWRTPPLWGAGLMARVNGSQQYLHDGRARSIEEAILWHGGEAAMARQKFADLSAEERHNLLQFVESL
ncbi:di-heme oxidoredictase family protein [Oceanobacter sp. 5_MG-2023]|uniref:di-heme oxidoreductase family protein n=1 Tax=Oceanobacter sp. 5_MG-2023 TaxID=3062645 RepID=UPI0026E41C63|nr:di-heme oxidoredictase family protein [Oceanobacter sp. 5_MG-2023]MDO6681896.1 di-heme oxidoredictase family protein [Oceanobacter sp. 5_MG-2023]